MIGACAPGRGRRRFEAFHGSRLAPLGERHIRLVQTQCLSGVPVRIRGGVRAWKTIPGILYVDLGSLDNSRQGGVCSRSCLKRSAHQDVRISCPCRRIGIVGELKPRASACGFESHLGHLTFPRLSMAGRVAVNDLMGVRISPGERVVFYEGECCREETRQNCRSRTRLSSRGCPEACVTLRMPEGG